MTTASECPDIVREYAEQAVEYVRRALGLKLSYDSETLPVLDHYLRDARGEEVTLALVVATSGAYFGEVVRQKLGGHWDTSAGDPGGWRLVLPGGVSFSPAGLAMAAIEENDEIDLDTRIDAPALARPYIEAALDRMGERSAADYFSLSGRYDTFECLLDMLYAFAAEKSKDKDDAAESN